MTGFGDLPQFQYLTSSRGLSALAVRAEVSMQSLSERSRCVRVCASRVENAIGCLEMLSIQPSALCAHFKVIYGRPRLCAVMNRRLRSTASFFRIPTVTSIPASRSIAIPRPETFGNGSRVATTTRRTLQSINNRAHGGVLP